MFCCTLCTVVLCTVYSVLLQDSSNYFQLEQLLDMNSEFVALVKLEVRKIGLLKRLLKVQIIGLTGKEKNIMLNETSRIFSLCRDPLNRYNDGFLSSG